jgi:hypothetical protein
MCIRDPSQIQRGEGLVCRSGQTIRRPAIESQLWLWRRRRESVRRREEFETNLLHDARLPLGKCDVATRLVCDELDLNLSALATGLIIVIIVVVGGGRTLALDSTTVAAGN